MPLCKNKFRFFLLAAFFLISSCSTVRALWDRTYTESFRQFAIGSEGNSVIFLGKNYHYIFVDKYGAIAELLTSQTRGFLFINVEKSRIAVDRKNNVSGYVMVESFFNRLPPEDDKFLRALGFRNEEGGALSLKINLEGQRFLPSNNLGPYLPLLDRTYIIPIHYQSSRLGNSGKVILTPFAAAFDALLLVKTILLLPFRGQ